ncbi:branched-chain amino acid ABC transporter permease [Lysinibacillus pakistanensis]|uniref:Branched-chain amino acid ABC transporter permease n=1 Tax=Lysinibacillus pakistanensis TaxID=759811 RepID=A0AAX3WUR6_9BACI|nr:branched-chain amino acid ABC transporter permease [Lysinibacillus pakistanensis]MDM5229735.1 branched-chain amino acid ABC transporter permease [Lysinibacillus pakistanensis]QGG52592.1 branched-chain amino acid ABC transporter permease [Lysinibacillus pakistanensis]WHY45343.1 branched-chain amino acid ABC transporter permease [Lysinibacillus pakistanensis]WHY50351.1 branched-chain amino acid ABC transporter permease [Lysinibacillus pakistanensis]
MKNKLSLKYVGFFLMLVILVLLPYVNDSRTLMILLTQIFIFGILAMSYDILLGYTGIVSFGHAMFFGIGAYTTSVMLKQMDNTLSIFILSIVVGLFIAGFISFLVGLLTLRLKSHFFAMLTLAFSGLFLVVAEKWRSVTYGNDGFTFRAPEIFRDRITFYFFVLACLVFIFIALYRFVNSPTGRILIAVRENEQRTKSLGYNTLHYKVIASVVAGTVASLAGSLYAISLRFVNTSVMTMDITLDALLMTIIGGVGTLVGPLLGAAVIEYAQHALSGLARDYPIFERWIIFFGILYILAVIFFPKGIIGSLRMMYWKWRLKLKKKDKVSVALSQEKERFE